MPFVGQAGKLLDKLLAGIGLTREDVYIANVLKCRPPGNRDPQPDEIAGLRGHLFRQIELIQPKVVRRWATSPRSSSRAGRSGSRACTGRSRRQISAATACCSTRSTTRPPRSTRRGCSTCSRRTSPAFPSSSAAEPLPVRPETPDDLEAVGAPAARHGPRPAASSSASSDPIRCGERGPGETGALGAARPRVLRVRRCGHLSRRAGGGQDDLRPRRLSCARRRGAGHQPHLHDRTPLRGARRRFASRPVPIQAVSRTRSGAISSRTSTTPWPSSSGRRRERASCRRHASASACNIVGEERADESRSSVLMIFAFDTATAIATSALVRDGTVIGERTTTPVRVLEAVDELVRESGVEPSGARCARGRDRPGQLHRHSHGARRRARARALRSTSPRPGVSTLDALAAGAPRSSRIDRREAAASSSSSATAK